MGQSAFQRQQYRDSVWIVRNGGVTRRRDGVEEGQRHRQRARPAIAQRADPGSHRRPETAPTRRSCRRWRRGQWPHRRRIESPAEFGVRRQRSRRAHAFELRVQARDVREHRAGPAAVPVRADQPGADTGCAGADGGLDPNSIHLRARSSRFMQWRGWSHCRSMVHPLGSGGKARVSLSEGCSKSCLGLSSHVRLRLDRSTATSHRRRKTAGEPAHPIQGPPSRMAR